jgi:ribonuclease P protein component
MGVSVSRETLKKQWTGTTLNVLRETYRLNKHILINNMDAPCSFMFFYQTKDRLSYEEINTKTIQLFEKFIAQNGKSNPVEIDKGLVKE